MSKQSEIFINLPNGMRVHKHGDTAVIIKEIWEEQSYQNLRDVGANDLVFDIGANQGIFALYAASKGAKVYAVEPDPANFAILQNNIAINGLNEKIIPINCAVASEAGSLTLYIPERNGQTLTGLITTTKEISKQYLDMGITALRELQIEALRLSDLFDKYKIQTIDLLKIDCEGAELDILSGGGPAEFRRVRHIIMETHSGYAESSLYRRVQALGFQVISYQKLSGVYSTGYLWAESLREAEHIAYRAPVAISELSHGRIIGDTLIVDASKSFSTSGDDETLSCRCELNGKPMQLGAPRMFTGKIEQKNLNSVTLTVTQNEHADTHEQHFWAFTRNYNKPGAMQASTQVLPFACDQELEIDNRHAFVLPSAVIPKSWDSRYLYVSVKIHDWHNLRTKPDLRFLFNDDEYRLTSQQKTLDFPYFPADTDFHFALQSDCPARITLCCFTTEKVIPKVEEDIDLGSGTQFNLEHQGQKYCCHASKESIFEFEINFGDWVPRCIKFGLSVGKTSLNRDELAGEMQVNGVSKKLDSWYQELTLEPPYLTSRVKVQLSMPLPRVCDVAWWPE